MVVNTNKIVNYLLALLSVLMIVSGLGITNYRMTEMLSLGLLGKAVSFQMHSLLWIPFTLLLILHVYLATLGRKARK